MLLLLPILAAMIAVAHWNARRALQRFVARPMLGRLSPRSNKLLLLTKTSLLLLGLAALIVALARPQFGEQEQLVVQRGVDMFVLLDVSRSMLATDVAPSRLERAKSDILDLLEKMRTDRVGLIAFAGAPVLRVPLTNDLGFFRLILDETDCDSAPRGGSLIGDAIRKSMELLERRVDRDQVVVLISDGDDHDSFPVDAARQAKERGIIIITVGLGDPAATTKIPYYDDQGNLKFVQHNGADVTTQLNESLLRQIALETAGAYIPARTRSYDLGTIYADHLAKLTRGTLRSEKHAVRQERYQWFAAFGLLCFAIEMIIPQFAKRSRTTNSNPISVATPKPVVATILSLLLVAFPATDGLAATADVGLDLFDKGQYAEAAKVLEEAAKQNPGDQRTIFNQACALAAAGELDKAMDLFRQVSTCRDTDLSSQALYNLGGLYVDKAKSVLGDTPEDATVEQRKEGVGNLLSAADHYRETVRIAPNNDAARHNLETVRLWIKQMQAVWKQLDRQRELASLDFLQLLENIEQRQFVILNTLRSTTLATPSTLPGSLRRQLVTQQSDVVNDLQVLAEKLREALKQTDEQTLSQVLKEVDHIGSSLSQAQQMIEQSQFTEAASAQKIGLDQINELFAMAADFERLVQKGIQEESVRIQAISDNQSRSPANQPIDTTYESWMQQRITRWSDQLNNLALSALQQPEQTPEKKSFFQQATSLAPQAKRLSEEASELLQNQQLEPAQQKQEQVLEILKKLQEQQPNQQQPNKPEDQQSQNDPNQNDQNQSDKDQQSDNNQQSQASQSREDNQHNDGKAQQDQADKQSQMPQDNQQNGANGQQKNDTSQQQKDGTNGNNSEENESPDRGSNEPQDKDDGNAAKQSSSGGAGEESAKQVSKTDQQASYSREQAMAILRRARERAAVYRERELERQKQSAPRAKTTKDW